MLPVDDLLQASLGVVQSTQTQRRGHRPDQRVDLPLDALLVQGQFADVFDDQMQQLEQQFLDFHLLFGGQRGPLAETGEQAQQRLDVHCRALQRLQQRTRLAEQPLVFAAQRRQQILDQAPDPGQQLGGQFAGLVIGLSLRRRSAVGRAG